MQENIDTTKIVCPLIPLRGLVLYPETLISIDLGRESSVAALEYAVDKNICPFDGAKDGREEHPGMKVCIRWVPSQRSVKPSLIPGDVIRILAEGKTARLLRYPP